VSLSLSFPIELRRTSEKGNKKTKQQQQHEEETKKSWCVSVTFTNDPSDKLASKHLQSFPSFVHSLSLSGLTISKLANLKTDLQSSL
jgi:hypothetical protein